MLLMLILLLLLLMLFLLLPLGERRWKCYQMYMVSQKSLKLDYGHLKKLKLYEVRKLYEEIFQLRPTRNL